MTIKEQLQLKLQEQNVETLLIHSDIMHGFNIPFKNKATFLSSHMEEILSLKQNMNIWMPTFNYDICKGSIYDIKESPSQVGAFTENFRKNFI